MFEARGFVSFRNNAPFRLVSFRFIFLHPSNFPRNNMLFLCDNLGDCYIYSFSIQFHTKLGPSKNTSLLFPFSLSNLFDVENQICLDAGSSTGGFSQVLLERKAAKVFCVDVGYGQLAWEVRNHPQVVVMERTNIRNMPSATLQPVPTIVVADLSFISLSQVLPPLIANAAEAADFLLMVKPQFEVGKDSLGAGGVVRDPGLRKEAIRKVIESGALLGLGCDGVVASALPGPKGNVEYFVWLKKGGATISDADIESAIAKGPQS
jgi:23S rRNA (cytidine1920-2'-O)/16S rRNA (cytidine1409-2'-O)-methyltransferase